MKTKTLLGYAYDGCYAHSQLHVKIHISEVGELPAKTALGRYLHTYLVHRLVMRIQINPVYLLKSTTFQ